MPHLRKKMACVLKKRPEEKSSGLLKFRPAALTKRTHLTAFGDDCPATDTVLHISIGGLGVFEQGDSMLRG